MQTMLDHDTAKRWIASNVAQILKIRGMTQADLARITGDNRMYISRVCRGECETSASGLARISEALQVSADDLLKNPAEKSKQPA